MYILVENVEIGKAQNEKGHIMVEVVDSVTGEGLNGVSVEVSWGSAFSEQASYTTQYGSAYFSIASWNYTGDVLISVWDEGKRYHPKSEIVHVSFTPWVNTSASVEIRLDRIIPLESSYSGDYVKLLIKDRDIVYYDELAYIVLGIKSPYYNNYLKCDIPNGMLVDVYGAGYISPLPLDGNITVRIRNRDYSHFEKSGTFNFSLQIETWSGMSTLETVQFTLTLKPSWGYDNYRLTVNTIDAQTKERIRKPLHIKAWWGSTFNNYKLKYTSEGVATFELGAYPDGSVRLMVDDYKGEYSSEFKEIIVTENPTTINVELQRTDDGRQAESPSSVYLLIASILIIALGLAIIGFFFIKKRKPTKNGVKPKPRIVYRYGSQYRQVRAFLEKRREILNVLRKLNA